MFVRGYLTPNSVLAKECLDNEPVQGSGQVGNLQVFSFLPLGVALVRFLGLQGEWLPWLTLTLGAAPSRVERGFCQGEMALS